jgi:hypothetical protein
MFESTLATTADADLILKLYELRTEANMRSARAWMAGEFFPQTAEEFFAISNARNAQENAWYRQVMSYWEMAAAFVLHGALNAELFVDCNNEPFLLYAKFLPLLPEIRKRMPGFLTKIEQVVEQSPAAQARVERATRNLAAMRAVMAEKK